MSKICVSVKADGKHCNAECPYFTLITGASFERPFIETCILFKTPLTANKGSVVRCHKCMEQSLAFKEHSRKYSLELQCCGKPAALELIKVTNYKINIFDYRPKELFEILLGLDFVTMEYLATLLDIPEDDIEKLMEDNPPMYLLKPLQMKIGIPRPAPPTAYDLKFGDAMAILRK